jgi:hypothetical protein
MTEREKLFSELKEKVARISDELQPGEGTRRLYSHHEVCLLLDVMNDRERKATADAAPDGDGGRVHRDSAHAAPPKKTWPWPIEWPVGFGDLDAWDDLMKHKFPQGSVIVGTLIMKEFLRLARIGLTHPESRPLAAVAEEMLLLLKNSYEVLGPREWGTLRQRIKDLLDRVETHQD